MKDPEFIELLNLYLDHEISAADAARLEAEVQGNPARRKVYQQYCRMQKACKRFATDFATEPADARDAAQWGAEKKIVAFDAARAEAARRARAGSFYTAGAFAAAAACVAIIFVGHSRQTAEAAAGIAALEQKQGAERMIVSAPSPEPASAVEIDLKPMMMMVSTHAEARPRTLGTVSNRTHATATLVADRQLRLTGNTQTDAMLAEAMQQASGRFAWLEEVRLPPIQRPVPLSELRFDARPTVIRTEGRALGNRAPAEATNADPQVAFQFIK